MAFPQSSGTSPLFNIVLKKSAWLLLHIYKFLLEFHLHQLICYSSFVWLPLKLLVQLSQHQHCLDLVLLAMSSHLPVHRIHLVHSLTLWNIPPIYCLSSLDLQVRFLFYLWWCSLCLELISCKIWQLNTQVSESLCSLLTDLGTVT